MSVIKEESNKIIKAPRVVRLEPNIKYKGDSKPEKDSDDSRFVVRIDATKKAIEVHLNQLNGINCGNNILNDHYTDVQHFYGVILELVVLKGQPFKYKGQTYYLGDSHAEYEIIDYIVPEGTLLVIGQTSGERTLRFAGELQCSIPAGSSFKDDSGFQINISEDTDVKICQIITTRDSDMLMKNILYGGGKLFMMPHGCICALVNDEIHFL